MIAEFMPVARAILGAKGAQDHQPSARAPTTSVACNAPIKALYDLGVAIEENSELDLLVEPTTSTRATSAYPKMIADMERELGDGNKMPGILPRLAQYEADAARHGPKATRACASTSRSPTSAGPRSRPSSASCPATSTAAWLRLGIPVACEVDIYGALSEYIGTCVTGNARHPAGHQQLRTPQTSTTSGHTPASSSYRQNETFMGFHCGNTPCCHADATRTMKYQLIMKRPLEPDSEPDITRGTLEGDIKPGDITFYRLQCDSRQPRCSAYVAAGRGSARGLPDPSAASASSPSRRWTASTAMC